jgi:transposase
MKARTVNNLPLAAAHDDAVRCLAIELNKKSWIVAANTPLSDKISRDKLKAPDWKELLKLIERIRTQVARELKKRVEVGVDRSARPSRGAAVPSMRNCARASPTQRNEKTS